MRDNLVPNRAIIAHEADEPNAVIDRFDAEFLAAQNGGDVSLSMQAGALRARLADAIE